MGDDLHVPYLIEDEDMDLCAYSYVADDHVDNLPKCFGNDNTNDR